MRISFRPILVCLASAIISASALAQPNLRVIGAKLEADPKQYVGQCPTVIHFHGSLLATTIDVTRPQERA